eukprot:710355-Amphidinium_carterae.3
MATLLLLNLEPATGKPSAFPAPMEFNELATADGFIDVRKMLDGEYGVPSYRKADKGHKANHRCSWVCKLMTSGGPVVASESNRDRDASTPTESSLNTPD